MAEQLYKQPSYIDMGFDAYGQNIVAVPSFNSANYNDAFLELSEASVGKSVLKKLSITNEKINDVDWTKIANILVQTADIEDAAITTEKVGDSEITNAKIVSLIVDKLTAGTISVAANIGDGNVQIDGANKRIIISDGTNDRVLIGYLSGGF